MNPSRDPATSQYETARSYDEIPYPTTAYPLTHPARMAAVGMLFGMTPAPVEGCRVLEIGCADGGNLIPLAESLPESRFLGLDISLSQIQRGQNLADRLLLTNVELRRQSFVDLSASDGPFDYIIAHGLLSWVPEPLGEQLFESIGRLLAPHGIAFVSYNTLPGWHARGILREAFLYGSRKLPETGKQLEKARELARMLGSIFAGSNAPYARFVAEQLEQVRGWSDGYLRHDVMELDNHPLYFHEFVEKAGSHDLRFLGETEFHTMFLQDIAPGVRQQLEKIAGDLIEREQFSDLVRGRMFRQSLLCHANQQLKRHVKPSIVRKFHISSPLTPVESAPDLGSTSSESFVDRRGVAIQVSAPVAKAAFLELARRWPGSVAYQPLLRAALARLPKHDGGGEAHAAAALDTALFLGILQTVVEISPVAAPFVVELSEMPEGSRLAREQAQQDRRVTNRRHDFVDLDDLHRRLLLLLNGSRTRDELAQALAEEAFRGAFELPARCVDAGGDIEETLDLPGLHEIMGRQLPGYLNELARHALLVG